MHVGMTVANSCIVAPAEPDTRCLEKDSFGLRVKMKTQLLSSDVLFAVFKLSQLPEVMDMKAMDTIFVRNATRTLHKNTAARETEETLPVSLALIQLVHWLGEQGEAMWKSSAVHSVGS
jgi:hypothetical protein